jgi:hypothetical protein
MRKMLAFFALLLFLPACGQANDALATSIKSAWLTSNAPTHSPTLSTNTELLSTETPLPLAETPIEATPNPTLNLPTPIDLKAVAIEYSDLGTRSELYSSTTLDITQGDCSEGSVRCIQVFKEFKVKTGVGDLFVFLLRFPGVYEDKTVKATSLDYSTRFGTIPNPASMELPSNITMFNDGSNLIVVFSQTHAIVQMVLSIDSNRISDPVYLDTESAFLFQLAQRQWQKIVEVSAKK